MSGEKAERLLSYGTRVGARMARRLSRVEDMYASRPTGIDFENFFDELDRCGHQWGAEECNCPACEQLRPQITALIQQALQGQTNG